MCVDILRFHSLTEKHFVSVNVDFPRFAVAAAMPLAGFSLAGGGANNAMNAAAGLRLPGVQSTGSVLLISNLNEEVTFEPFPPNVNPFGFCVFQLNI